MALLIVVAPADAATTPSDVVVLAASELGPGGNTAVIGMVRSPNRRCVSGRRIKVSVVAPAGRTPVDVARSGKNGGWYARGPTGLLAGASAIIVKLEKRRIGAGPGAVRCDGARVKLT